MSAARIVAPATTALLLYLMVPFAGRVVILTASSVLGGESFGSVSAKSAAANVYVASSLIVLELFAPDGGSFTAVTLIVSVLGVGSVSTPPLAVPPLSW